MNDLVTGVEKNKKQDTCLSIYRFQKVATADAEVGRFEVLQGQNAYFFWLTSLLLFSMSRKSYDVIIVGAGVAGSALAHGLSTLPRSKPLRIALVERSLAEPDRIVGELLQPGGVMALKKLGIDWCLKDIDAISVKGYCVTEKGNSVHIPYPASHEGRSFHHGRFIMRLREAAKIAKGVEVLEGTVTELIEAGQNRRVVGVKVTRKAGEGTGSLKDELFADVTIIADGCFSNFRNTVMGSSIAKPITRSYFFGAILEDARLPIPNHGTVALVSGYGPVLLYQIAGNETRILIDLKHPLPSDPKACDSLFIHVALTLLVTNCIFLQTHILENIVPQLPSSLHHPIQNALEKDRLRRMPNSFLPPIDQGTGKSREGAFLIGDSWNMRHPLTGGGMTVALNDVVMLRKLLGSVTDFSDWKQVRKALHRWHWDRKPLSSTINILSVALYDLFGADGEYDAHIQDACNNYFRRGTSSAENRLLQVFRKRRGMCERSRFSPLGASIVLSFLFNL